MKVLHIGLNFEYNTTMIKAIKSLGEYCSLDWRKIFSIKGKTIMEQYILDTVKSYKPNFIFMQIQRGGIITPEIISRILKIVPGVIIFNWTGDVSISLDEWYFDVAKLSDNIHTGFSDAESVLILKSKGIKNVYHIQIGFEETIMSCKPDDEFGNDIVFLSNFYKHFPMAELKKKTSDLLAEKYGDKFTLYGNGWGGKTVMVKMTKAPAIYKGSKIAIGINNIANYHYTSDRLFNVMASGCFYLVNYYDGIERDFENKKHLVWWKTTDELIEHIDYYLSNNSERIEIAKQGYNEVWKNHRWKNRIETIKKDVLK